MRVSKEKAKLYNGNKRPPFDIIKQVLPTAEKTKGGRPEWAKTAYHILDGSVNII